MKFYLGITLLKESLAKSEYADNIKVGNRTLSELLLSPDYQANMEQKVTKLIKIVGMEILERFFEFEERVTNITVERKVGRPKKIRKVGRPKQ